MASRNWIRPSDGTGIRTWDGWVGTVETIEGKPVVSMLGGPRQPRVLTWAGELAGLWKRCVPETRVPEEKKAPVFQSPPRPRSFTSILDQLEDTALRGIREDARIDRINTFYQMVVKDAGRKIKTPLPEGELKFWEDAMNEVKANYTLRGYKPIMDMRGFDRCLDKWDCDFSTYAELIRRRRIRYLRGLFCQNKNTDHLKESGWAFWEKCMRNVDAHYAKERAKPVFEWKTDRVLTKKVDAQREQVKWTEEILRALAVPGIHIYGGVDYAKKDADVTSVLCGVRGEAPARRGTPGDEPVFRSPPPKAPTIPPGEYVMVPKTEADLLAAKVSRLESENEILRKAPTPWPYLQRFSRIRKALEMDKGATTEEITFAAIRAIEISRPRTRSSRAR